MKNLNILVQDAKDVLDDLGIEYGPIATVTINSRAKSRWGRCKRVGDVYHIEISSDLMYDDVEWESAMNTMIHELLHAHKDRMCHTGEWKRCANLVNRKYPIYNIKRCSSAEERGVVRAKPTYKYKLMCDGCNSINYYQKETKAIVKIRAQGNQSGYRCGRCGSTMLRVTTV